MWIYRFHGFTRTRLGILAFLYRSFEIFPWRETVRVVSKWAPQGTNLEGARHCVNMS